MMLSDSYLEWQPTKLASKVFEPAPAGIAGLHLASSNQLMGYFEDLANKMISYETYRNPDPSTDYLHIDYDSKDFFDSIKPKESKYAKLSLAKKFTSSEDTALHEGNDLSQPSYRKHTDKVRPFYERNLTRYSCKTLIPRPRTAANWTLLKCGK